jgi:transposase
MNNQCKLCGKTDIKDDLCLRCNFFINQLTEVIDYKGNRDAITPGTYSQIKHWVLDIVGTDTSSECHKCGVRSGHGKCGWQHVFNKPTQIPHTIVSFCPHCSKLSEVKTEIEERNIQIYK